MGYGPTYKWVCPQCQSLCWRGVGYKPSGVRATVEGYTKPVTCEEVIVEQVFEGAGIVGLKGIVGF